MSISTDERMRPTVFNKYSKPVC